ncbi:MAG: FCD domain-containing protein [Novosphingobium sp.]
MKRNLVSETAEALRQRVFAADPGHLIGSLSDLTRDLGVGVVTLQQAARVVEHEGLLEARRGPGGGYYGARPDEAALERAIAVYLRTHPASFGEALNITSLLFNEICAAAAGCDDQALRTELAQLAERIDSSDSEAERGGFESDFQHLLFRMVRWPLFELLTQVTLRFAETREGRVIDSQSLAAWKGGRHRIIAAILGGDGELARFEAERSNRRAVMGAASPRR